MNTRLLSMTVMLGACAGDVYDALPPAPVVNAQVEPEPAAEAEAAPAHLERSVSPEAPGCPAPRPPLEKLQLNAHVHLRWVDATPVVVKACDYCTSIGMGSYADGVPRCGCPMRAELPEGSGPNLERERCEAYVLGGKPRWEAMPTGTPRVNPDNAFQARCDGAGCQSVRVCNVAATVCSEWVVSP